MILQWCDAEPCRGAMCPDALKRYGHPTVGHTIPVPTGEHSKAAILNLFERHLTTAVVRDRTGIARKMPTGLAFTIHTVATTDPPAQYYTAMYSGTADLAAVLHAAPLADPQDAQPPEDATPANRWNWEPEETTLVVSDSAVPGWDRAAPEPELRAPGVASQNRQW